MHVCSFYYTINDDDQRNLTAVNPHSRHRFSDAGAFNQPDRTKTDATIPLSVVRVRLDRSTRLKPFSKYDMLTIRNLYNPCTCKQE